MFDRLTLVAERLVYSYERWVEASIKRAEHLTAMELRDEAALREEQIVSMPYGTMMRVHPDVAKRALMVYGPGPAEVEKLRDMLEKHGAAK